MTILTLGILGLIIFLIDKKARNILVSRQREIIYRVRDSLFSERLSLFNVDLDKRNVYTFKIKKNDFVNQYSIKFSKNTEGVFLKNPFSNNIILKINNKTFDNATHLISYNRQGDFILDDSKIVAFASKKIFDALSESKKIKVKIDDLPESYLEPSYPETPYPEDFFNKFEFENEGSVKMPPINWASLPLNVKVGNKNGMPQVLKGAYIIDPSTTVFIWILNDPNFPLIVKMKGESNFDLTEISQ